MHFSRRKYQVYSQLYEPKNPTNTDMRKYDDVGIAIAK